MDSPYAALFFRRLFSQTCRHGHPTASLHSRFAKLRHFYRHAGTYSRARRDGQGDETAWQRRTDILPEDKLEEFKKYDMVTADDLRNKKRRPKRTKMLMRDFIEGAAFRSLQLALLQPTCR